MRLPTLEQNNALSLLRSVVVPAALFALCCGLASSKPVAAADLYYSDADGIMSREEKIDFTTISFHGGLADVRVQSPSVNCKLRGLSVAEAKRIQGRLSTDLDAAIQCFGKFTVATKPGVIEIETSSFVVSRKEREKTLETKSVATGL